MEGYLLLINYKTMQPDFSPSVYSYRYSSTNITLALQTLYPLTPACFYLLTHTHTPQLRSFELKENPVSQLGITTLQCINT